MGVLCRRLRGARIVLYSSYREASEYRRFVQDNKAFAPARRRSSGGERDVAGSAVDLRL